MYGNMLITYHKHTILMVVPVRHRSRLFNKDALQVRLLTSYNRLF